MYTAHVTGIKEFMSVRVYVFVKRNLYRFCKILVTESLQSHGSRVSNSIPGRASIHISNVCLMAQENLDNETIEG